MACENIKLSAWFWVVIAIVGVLILLLVILLPLSFSYIDFYEYGFLRRRTTGRVNLDKVYEGGRYLVGPDHEFKEFKATAQHVNFNNIAVFTTDNLQVHLVNN